MDLRLQREYEQWDKKLLDLSQKIFSKSGREWIPSGGENGTRLALLQTKERLKRSSQEYDPISDEQVRKYLGLVCHIASRIQREYKFYQIPIEDLIGYGNIGLLEALNRLRPDESEKTTVSYISRVIKGNIIEGVRHGGPLSSSFYRKKGDVQRAIKTYEKDNIGGHTLEKISEITGISVQTMNDIFFIVPMPFISLYPLEEKETIKDPNTSIVEVLSSLEERIAVLSAIYQTRNIGKVRGRTAAILYAIDIHEESSVSIARILGITESRVSSIRKSGRNYLKTILAKNFQR